MHVIPANAGIQSFFLERYRGRDSALDCTAPPSEPDWRISRIRLSGRRFYLMRTGRSMTRAQKACTHTCLREVGPGVPASSAGLQPGSLHSPLESFQHAETQCEAAPNLDSQRLSPIAGHSHGWRLLPITAAASAFLHPFAPWALPHISAHMGALTPVRLTRSQPLAGQVSLVHMTRTSMHSVTIHLTRPIIASALPAQRDRLPGIRSDGFALSAAGSGLHLESAGSSLRTAESCSSSYGLHVRLGLLPTPPRGDAVTFDYRERASPGGGLAPPCSRLLPGARIPAFAGMTNDRPFRLFGHALNSTALSPMPGGHNQP